jgi:hypothetical protein
VTSGRTARTRRSAYAFTLGLRGEIVTTWIPDSTLQRVPKYRPTLIDTHRDYLRKRRAEEPGVPVGPLLREIRELGSQGSSNLGVRYIDQGRPDSDRPPLSPRPAARILLTRPDRLTAGQQLTAACPEITTLASLVASFAALLVPDRATTPGSGNGSPTGAPRTCPPALLHPRP